jgi:hypothetical protein
MLTTANALILDFDQMAVQGAKVIWYLTWQMAECPLLIL